MRPKILIVIVLLIVVLALAWGGTCLFLISDCGSYNGLSEFDLTATYIDQLNATIEIQVTQTAAAR